VKARVHIFYKDSVFDPQGNTVQHSLQQLGFQQASSVRIGKVIDVEVNSATREEAKKLAEKMCETLLVNPVMESFQVEILD
jgi:phosphoribosylformylglycinamidine synthase PurS subunit